MKRCFFQVKVSFVIKKKQSQQMIAVAFAEIGAKDLVDTSNSYSARNRQTPVDSPVGSTHTPQG